MKIEIKFYTSAVNTTFLIQINSAFSLYNKHTIVFQKDILDILKTTSSLVKLISSLTFTPLFNILLETIISAADLSLLANVFKIS